VREQFTHGAWAPLKTQNAGRSIPLPTALRDLLKGRYASLNKVSIVLRPREDGRLVFTSPEGGEVEYANWRTRRWLPLLAATAPDENHPKRVAVTGTPHMLRHPYATALIQSGENAKTVQTLMGHHSVAFTMDQYADAWPEALSNAGEKAAALLFSASGSKTVADGGERDSNITQVSDLMTLPGAVEALTNPPESRRSSSPRSRTESSPVARIPWQPSVGSGAPRQDRRAAAPVRNAIGSTPPTA